MIGHRRGESHPLYQQYIPFIINYDVVVDYFDQVSAE
jgi:hypothetical protein